MKIWTGYGSEHSANLVMLGKFKSQEDATGFLEELEKLKTAVQDEMSNGDVFYDFPKPILDAMVYGRIRFCSDFAPKDLDDFVQELSHKQLTDDPAVVEFRSDVTGWAGLIKMLLNAGARVEVFDKGNEAE